MPKELVAVTETKGLLNRTGKRLNFDLEQWKLNLENFPRKKQQPNIVQIITHAQSFDRPVQLPLGHRHIAADFCLNHFFIIQLTLTSPNPREVLALALALALAPI